MTNSDPQEKTKILIDVLNELKIPAILNVSGGGLVEPEAYDKSLICFVKSIPYDWVFPQMYATVHHGGAGTTQSSLKDKLWDLYNNPQYKANAVSLGERMRAEECSEMLYKFIVDNVKN